MKLFEKIAYNKISVNRKLLKYFRTKKQLTVRSFAASCGIDYTYISKIETGSVASVTYKTRDKIIRGMKKIESERMN